MRFSILAVFLFFNLTGKSIYAIGNISSSDIINILIQENQWQEADNENRIYVFSETGELKLIEIEEFDIVVEDLSWALNTETTDAQLDIFNDGGILIEQMKLSISEEGLLWQSQTDTNKLLINTNSNDYKLKTCQLIGRWRGRYLSKKVCLKGERFVQESVEFKFTDHNKFEAIYEIDGKEKEIKGNYLIIGSKKAIVFLPKNKFQRRFSVNIKHISDNEIVLDTNPGKNKTANNITLIR